MKKILFYFLISLIGLIIIYPLLITITNSFMTENEISVNYETRFSLLTIGEEIERNFINMNLIPNEVTFQQYREVLIYQPSFLILLLNSVKITVPVLVGNVIFSLMSGYAFTIMKWKYKEVLFFIYIIVMLMPLQAVIVPNYIIADKLNIKDSYLAIILPGIFAPFGTFLMRQGMSSMPKEYFEAAQVDGASNLYIFWHIIIPQVKSLISALAILVFIEYWNIVDQAIIFIDEYYREPLSVYLSRMSDGKVAIIFAASCIYMFLPLWFLILGQKDLEKGIELSGIK